MNILLFVFKIILNSILAVFYFIFKYLLIVFKRLRSRPWVISQIEAVAMLTIPIGIFIAIPFQYVFCIYCIVAMLYGIYQTYQDDIEYEKAYHVEKSVRYQEILKEARLKYGSGSAQQNNDSSQQNSSEQENNGQTNNNEQINNNSTQFIPFTDTMTLEEAKARYYQLIKMGHPDNGGDEEFIKYINAEYEKFCKSKTPKISPNQFVFCTQCGTKHDATSKFCFKCGQKL